MPSRPDRGMHLCFAGILACVMLSFACVTRAAEVTPVYPTRHEVEDAIHTVLADPNLATERKTQRLRWISSGDSQPPPSWLRWFIGLFEWLGTTLRLIVWILIGLLVLMLVVAIARQMRELELRKGVAGGQRPTHVRDLDIRPESLPDDVGAAALQLWERGEHRAALSLLYRGLLSRLVHTFSVPIRASSTEGDCLHLAERHLAQDRIIYAARLVRVWQRAIYGGKDPETSDVRSLCVEFAAALTLPVKASA